MEYSPRISPLRARAPKGRYPSPADCNPNNGPRSRLGELNADRQLSIFSRWYSFATPLMSCVITRSDDHGEGDLRRRLTARRPVATGSDLVRRFRRFDHAAGPRPFID